MELSNSRNVEGTVSEVIELQMDTTQPLDINVQRSYNSYNPIKLIERDVDIEMDNTAKTVRIVVVKSAYGRNIADAIKKAKALPTGVTAEGNSITIDKYLSLTLAEASFMPEVDIEVYYPSNVTVFSSNH